MCRWMRNARSGSAAVRSTGSRLSLIHIYPALAAGFALHGIQKKGFQLFVQLVQLVLRHAQPVVGDADAQSAVACADADGQMAFSDLALDAVVNGVLHNGLQSQDVYKRQALESLDVLSVLEALQQLKSQMLASPGITGHELLQMTKEVCNRDLFFMKNYRIRIEDDFLENYNRGADNCASAQELFDYLIRKITASYDMACLLYTSRCV